GRTEQRVTGQFETPAHDPIRELQPELATFNRPRARLIVLPRAPERTGAARIEHAVSHDGHAQSSEGAAAEEFLMLPMADQLWIDDAAGPRRRSRLRCRRGRSFGGRS